MGAHSHSTNTLINDDYCSQQHYTNNSVFYSCHEGTGLFVPTFSSSKKIKNNLGFSVSSRDTSTVPFPSLACPELQQQSRPLPSKPPPIQHAALWYRTNSDSKTVSSLGQSGLLTYRCYEYRREIISSTSQRAFIFKVFMF